MNTSLIVVAALLTTPIAGFLTYQSFDSPVVAIAEPTYAAEADADRAPEAAPEAKPAAAQRESERHEGEQTIVYAVGHPYPTCPLSCTMGRSFGEGKLEFEVPEGATRVDVRARWDATLPTAERLRVGLYTPDAECGENCWMGVAGEEGVESVIFTHEAPAPGEYRVAAHGTGPAYLILQQTVDLEAVVHFS